MQVVYEKPRFSTNISQYLGNNTRQLLRYANKIAIYRMMPFPMTLNSP